MQNGRNLANKREYMLEFKSIELSDKPIIEKFYKKKNYFLCGYCFTDIFIWAHAYDTKFAVEDGFIFMSYTDEGEVTFSAPIGEGDYKKALEKLKEYADSISAPLRIDMVPPDHIQLIEDAMPGYFDFVQSLDYADYIYSAEKLMYLKGKKLHGKRNHINKFMQTYSNWSYEPLTDENTKEFFEYQLDWCKDDPDEFLGETCAVSIALKNREALGIVGGLLRLDGKLIAVTLGSESFPDTFIVQIEKADHTIQGAYQMINQQFALHNFEKYTYIDREEDMGIEGLRKAKQSYYPEFQAEVYYAIPKQ